MSIKGGPNIVSSGLVLCADPSNPKAYYGDPTVNMINSQLLSPGVYAYATGPTLIGQNTYRYTVSSAVNTSRGKFDVSCSIATDYTFSCKMRYNGPYVPGAPNFTISAAKPSPESGNTLVLANQSQTSTRLNNGWYDVAYRFNIQSNTAAACLLTFGLDTGGDSNYTGSTWDMANPQFESKSYATQYVSGSRGSTIATGGGILNSSGRGNSGATYNLRHYPGTAMGSLWYNGTSSYIDFGTSSDFDVGNNITVIAWGMITASLDVFQCMVSKISGGYTAGWELDSNYGGGVRCTLRPSATQINVQDSIPIVLNRWFMGGFTFDGTTARIYHDGIQTAFTSTGGPVTLNTSASLEVGARFGGTNAVWAGNIGLVQVYNRVLSNDEILLNYNTNKGRFGL